MVQGTTMLQQLFKDNVDVLMPEMSKNINPQTHSITTVLSNPQLATSSKDVTGAGRKLIPYIRFHAKMSSFGEWQKSKFTVHPRKKNSISYRMNNCHFIKCVTVQRSK